MTVDPIAIGTCAPACVPTGPEVCDGIDNNCNGSIDEGDVCGPACVATGVEVCDGIDNDCDGQVDEQSAGAGMQCSTGFPGACGSGITVCTNGMLSCNADITPGTMAEVCDGQDNDCDGFADEGNPGGGASCTTGLPGACGAGVRVCSNGALSCVATAQPTAEVCDGIDNNCNGQVDDGAGAVYFRDADNDGYGTPSQTSQACSRPVGYALLGTDCNDANANVNPGRPEACDGVDNNCNAATDEGNLCPSFPNSIGACQSGACGIAACNAGFGNCDNTIATGCEVNLANNINHCGGCNLQCTFPNAIPACSSGTCQLLGCLAGYSNCDGNIINGCETFGACSINNNEWKQWQ